MCSDQGAHDHDEGHERSSAACGGRTLDVAVLLQGFRQPLDGLLVSVSRTLSGSTMISSGITRAPCAGARDGACAGQEVPKPRLGPPGLR